MLSLKSKMTLPKDTSSSSHLSSDLHHCTQQPTTLFLCSLMALFHQHVMKNTFAPSNRFHTVSRNMCMTCRGLNASDLATQRPGLYKHSASSPQLWIIALLVWQHKLARQEELVTLSSFIPVTQHWFTLLHCWLRPLKTARHHLKCTSKKFQPRVA